MFAGTYEFDAARQLNKVRLRLDVPPEARWSPDFPLAPPAPRSISSARSQRSAPETAAVVEVAGAPVERELTYLGPLPN